MSNCLKPVVLGLGLVAGIALGVQAQTVMVAPAPGPSVASLPPEGPRANSSNSISAPSHQALAPSGSYPGPNPGAGGNSSSPPHFAVTPSPQYIGPKPN